MGIGSERRVERRPEMRYEIGTDKIQFRESNVFYLAMDVLY
jgi:hypothetical protein